METNTTHIFESIVKNDSRAIKNIAETDNSLDKSYKDYIIWELDRIERETDLLKKINRMGILITGVFNQLK